MILKKLATLALCLLLTLSLVPAMAAPAPAWAQTGDIATEGFPQLTPEGFMPEGQKEYVFIDEEAGVWRYASQTLRVVINRTETTVEKSKLRYLTAQIFLKEGSQSFRMFAHDPAHKVEVRDAYKEKPVIIARNNNVVFSMDGDYYLYRVSRAQEVGQGYALGVVIRDGELLFDRPIKLGRELYPPLDMMALFDNGDMQVFKANEKTAQELLDMGARDVLSFGPVLIRDGQLGEFHKVKGATPQPRAGMGMFAPGHYLAIIAEGRIKPSAGLSTAKFAELFQSYGVTTAFNLDGGWTSAMVFMGKQLNQLDNSGVKDNARPQNEIMGIGYTENYPDYGKK